MTCHPRTTLLFVFALAGGCDLSPSANRGENAVSDAEPRIAARATPVAAPYLQVSAPDLPVPDTDDHGRFSIERGCVVFTTVGGKRYTPVLPAGSRVTADREGQPAITIGRGIVELGSRIMLYGGEGRYGPAPPSFCPQRQYLVG